MSKPHVMIERTLQLVCALRGFKNTSEFKVMKYKQAINGPDGEACHKKSRTKPVHGGKSRYFKLLSRIHCHKVQNSSIALGHAIRKAMVPCRVD